MKTLLDRIAEAFGESGKTEPITTADIERITTLLLVEIARADHDIANTEREAIAKALADSSSLARTEIDQLINDVLEEADNAISLHEHVQLINQHFSKDEKTALLEQMWRVAAADGDIDGYEDYTIRKLCDLLFLKHREFMQAKLKVLGA